MYEDFDEIVMSTDDESEDKRKEFVIDDSSKADWAVSKIREEQERFTLYKEAMDKKILDLKTKLANEEMKLDTRTSFLRFKLNEYLDTVPAKETKTQKSLKLPSGTIIRKFGTTKLATKNGGTGIKLNSDKDLIKWCEENDSDVLKYTESVEWSKLKDYLTIVGDDVVYNPSGEICDALQVITESTKIIVKE